MEITTDENLESTGYRRLFECVQEEGIEQVIRFIQDANKICFQKEKMLKQAILYGKNDLLGLIKRNLNIVKYLRKYEKDLNTVNFSNKNVFKTLNSLLEDISLLELYLNNARRLEELKVSHVKFSTFPDEKFCYCKIYRNEQGEIHTIYKSYTDGQIISVYPEREREGAFHLSLIGFLIGNQNENESFVLNTYNYETGYQCREIEIKDFGFDESKLPTLEEVQSYEIPNYLIKKRN